MNYNLYHSGVLGMHWGIRRYQNKDGTLTDAGKRRYSKNAKFRNEINSQIQRSDNLRKQFGVPKKEAIVAEQSSSGIKSMSDSDLQTAVNRMRLEDQYAELLAKRVPKPEPTKQSFAKQLVEEAGKKLAKDMANKIVEKTVEKAIKKAFPEHDTITDMTQDVTKVGNKALEKMKNRATNELLVRNYQEKYRN